MNKISAETKIGIGIMFSVSFWAAIDGKISFWWLALFPVFYGLLSLSVEIFVWDKKKQFELRVSVPAFSKGDILKYGATDAIVLKVEDKASGITLTLFPIKTSNKRLINKIKLIYIRMSYFLRTI